MPDVDQSYFERRARQERELAMASRDGRIAAIHAELAEQYESRLRAAMPGEPAYA